MTTIETPKLITDADRHFIDIVTRDTSPYLSTRQAADALGIPQRRFQDITAQGVPFGFVTVSGTGRRDGLFLKSVLWRWYFGSGGDAA
ncbi:MAG: hypothetical protein IJG85_05015 [Eubacteriaceae bacterium]|nr:hypothetical protein [Eubacteriaceae bacterium]